MKSNFNASNRSVKNSMGRALFVAIALISQVIWMVILITYAGDNYPYISLATSLIAFFAVVGVYSQHHTSAYKSLWLVLILVFPILGVIMFLLLGQPWAPHSIRTRFKRFDKERSAYLQPDPQTLQAAEAENPQTRNLLNYLDKWGGYPPCAGTSVTFHPDTSYAFEDLKRELRNARHFIFMEYHAIEVSSSFLELEEILAERAAANVEVRIFYDDLGSAFFIGPQFIERMRSKGIQCAVFNPIIPIISPFMNNRDHRKITVIDNRVAFTGGYNLADEYFNRTHPYGYWKDTGVMLRGSAVRNMTVMFLEMWNAVQTTDVSFSPYISLPAEPVPSKGWVQPFADSPLDDERVGENVYLNAIKCAVRRVYIATPYLILDDEMIQELTLAARRGVDVRIFTPGIPDKKIVYQLTRSYYPYLARCGVRIFEFTPGFLHAKMLVVDDHIAVVGTINLDFRSLYLHFEDGVQILDNPVIEEIADGFEDIQKQCREMTDYCLEHRPVIRRIIFSFLRLFAPLV